LSSNASFRSGTFSGWEVAYLGTEHTRRHDRDLQASTKRDPIQTTEASPVAPDLTHHAPVAAYQVRRGTRYVGGNVAASRAS
jgi:hypothetical protein